MAYETRTRDLAGRRERIDRPRAANGCRRREGCGAYCDDLDAVRASHRRQHVARVDGAHERIGGLNGNHVRDLRNVEQRSHARHRVLRGGGRGRQYVGIVGRDRRDQRGQVLGQRMRIVRRIGDPHAFYAGDACGLFGHCRALRSGDKHMNVVAKTRSGGDGVQRRSLQRLIVVFRNNEYGHVSLPVR
jgi:hypothetical protein